MTASWVTATRWCSGRTDKNLVEHWVLYVPLRCIWKVQGRWESVADARTNHKRWWRKIRSWPSLETKGHQNIFLAEQLFYGIEPNKIVEEKTRELIPELKNFYQVSIKVDVEKRILQNPEARGVRSHKLAKTVVYHITQLKAQTNLGKWGKSAKQPLSLEEFRWTITSWQDRTYCRIWLESSSGSENKRSPSPPTLRRCSHRWKYHLQIVKCCDFYGATILVNPLRRLGMDDISSVQKVCQLALIMPCNKLQKITHRSPRKLPNWYCGTSIWMSLSSLFPALSRLLKSTMCCERRLSLNKMD